MILWLKPMENKNWSKYTIKRKSCKKIKVIFYDIGISNAQKISFKYAKKIIYYDLWGRVKQRTTAVACCEKIAKLIPFSTSDTPSGNAWPGKTFKDLLAFSVGGASS